VHRVRRVTVVREDLAEEEAQGGGGRKRSSLLLTLELPINWWSTPTRCCWYRRNLCSQIKSCAFFLTIQNVGAARFFFRFKTSVLQCFRGKGGLI